MAVEYRLLGDVEVLVDGRQVEVGHARQRAVLAALLVDVGRPVPADLLLDRVWGDAQPQRARVVLSGYISRLRRALRAAAPAAITRQAAGYRLAADPMTVDLHRFRTLAAQARGVDGDDRAVALYERALGLWQGEPFGPLDTRWLTEVRAAIEAERLAVELDRNDAVMRLGGGPDLLSELAARAAAHPFDERLASQLMRALYRGGRQAEALAVYERIRRRLAGDLGADPSPPLRRLHAAILRQDSTLDSFAAPPGNLPAPLTSFVGRDRELACLREVLATSRLVTVTGVGGAGKSRLALEAARAAALDYPDGAWLVELATLTRPGLVVNLVCEALGVRERPGRTLLDLLVERVRTAGALLVLDNCEHLLDEVAQLAHHLLAAGSRLRVLATSRERIGVTGEALWPVSGLTDADAVRLFTERATAIDPTFHLDARATADLTRACRCLDGLPLAIELAAACVRAPGVGHIADHLDDRFRLLTQGSRSAPARHQTLRATVDWSYGLLDDAQRRLFDRLAVFVGGFTIDAVEEVCCDTPAERESAAGRLAELVAKSLVASEPGAGSGRRYRTLETLRVYGLERLHERGETDRMRGRHAEFVAELVSSSRRELRGARQAAWLRQLEVEHGNIRAALTWCHEQRDAATALRLAGALYPLWDRHGHYSEGRQWLSRALDLDAPAPPRVRARALDSAAGLAAIQGDFKEATAAGEQAAELCRVSGDAAGLASALLTLGFVAMFAGETDHAVTRLESALRHARGVGDRWLESWSLLYLGLTALARAEYGRAAALSVECEAALGPAGDPECRAWAQTVRAAAAWRLDDFAAVTEPLATGLRGFLDLGHLWGLSVGLFVAAHRAAERGEMRQMAILCGASEGIRDRVGAALAPFVRPWLAAAITRARAALGADAFDHAWRTGQALTPAAAVAAALD